MERVRRLALIAFMGAAWLALPEAAGAAVNSALLQGGCVSVPPLTGCTQTAGPLQDAVEPAFTADGKHLYVPGRLSNSLVMFDRNPTTGALTQRACFTMVQTANCTHVAAAPIERPESVAISGTSLYLVGSNYSGGSKPDGILRFDLDPATGVPTPAECYVDKVDPDCIQILGLEGATSIAVSPDGGSVYVASEQSGSALAILRRNKADGTLNQTGVTTGCFRRTAGGGCDGEPLLNTPRDVEVTPDGKQVLIANYGCVGDDADCYSVVAFDRDPVTGALTRHPGKGGCISATPNSQRCQTRAGLENYTQLAIADGGRHIYAAARSGGLILIDRNPTSGDLSLRAGSCVSSGAVCPVTSAAVADAFDVTLSPDGGTIYTSSFGTRRIGLFRRTADGTATPTPLPHGCLTARVVDECPGALPTAFADTTFNFGLPSPDGRHYYAIGHDRLIAFKVDRAPVCTNLSAATPHNTLTTVALQCTDPDGDALEYRIVRQPARGTLGALQGRSVAYGPLAGVVGPDTFTYTAKGAAAEADPATVTVNVGAPPPALAACIDADGDGFCSSQDCDDANPLVRPGAREQPGNRVDENCDSVVEPFPALTTRIAASWRVNGARVKLTALLLRAPLPKGVKAELRCSGKKCPFKKRKLSGKARKGTLNVYKSLRKKVNFRAGQVLEVRVSAPDHTGTVLRFSLKKGKVPSGVPLCLPAGSNRPQRSC